MLISTAMADFETRLKQVVTDFSALIRNVILMNLHKTDDIDLEDIEQEIKIKLWKLLRKGKKVENLPSYIRKVAYSATVDELRKMRKQAPARELQSRADRDALGDLLSSKWPSQSPQDELEWKETRAAIRSLIEELGEDRKHVLLLYLAGMSIEEISEFCRWDRIKVRHLLYRGIGDLREKMGRPSGDGTSIG
jgi:RNA polymerase sigma-70 factor (ECF subfamily)